MLKDRCQKNNIIRLAQRSCLFDTNTFNVDAMFLACNLCKRRRHLYPTNVPSSVRSAAKEFSTATAQFQHLAWLPEHGFRKGS